MAAFLVDLHPVLIVLWNSRRTLPIKYGFYYCDPRSEGTVTCQTSRNV